MGSWNQTCALSNLPIFAEEDVVCIFIGHEEGNFEFRYAAPFAMYCLGKYDDYGLVHSPTGLTVEPILNILRKNALPQEEILSESGYVTAPELNPKTATWDEFMQADQDDRLLYKTNTRSRPDEYRIHHIQIRKDVFDDVMSEQRVELRKENEDWGVTKTVADVMEDFDEYFEGKIINPLGSHLGFTHQKNYLVDLFAFRRLGLVLTEGHPEVVLMNMERDGKTKDQCREVMQNMVEMEFLNAFYRQIHRTWVLPGHAGQEGDVNAHFRLASIMINRGEEIASRWDDEYY